MICGKNKEASDEHIIPKALGNEKLRTAKICGECNNKLGKFVDAPFINGFDMKLIRASLGIKSHSRKIPNPFERGTDKKGNIVFMDDNIIPRYRGQINNKENGFEIIADSKNEALKMGMKKLNKMNSSQEQLQLFKDQVEKSKPKSTDEVIVNGQIDLEAANFEFIKIAYEFFYDMIGEEYYNDPIAKRLRYVLKKRIAEKTVSTNGLIGDVPKEVSESAKRFRMPCHLLILTQDESNRLMIFIFLFNGSSAKNVLLSMNAGKYHLDAPTKTILVEI